MRAVFMYLVKYRYLFRLSAKEMENISEIILILLNYGVSLKFKNRSDATVDHSPRFPREKNPNE